MPLELIVIASCTFLLGSLFGSYATHEKWAAKAKSPPRMLWGGRFYYVIEDGDLKKARFVVELMEQDIRQNWLEQ